MSHAWPTELSVSALSSAPAKTGSLQQAGWAGIGRFGCVRDNLIAAAILPGLKKKYGKIEVLSSEPQQIGAGCLQHSCSSNRKMTSYQA